MLDLASYFSDDFFLANTPSYFARKTRENPRLREVLEKYSTDELEAAICAGSAPSATSLEIVAAYVALIALLQSGDERTLARLRATPPAGLKWFGAFLDDWNRHAYPATFKSFRVPLQMKSPSRATDHSNTVLRLEVGASKHD
jgi:hypothetical protein